MNTQKKDITSGSDVCIVLIQNTTTNMIICT